MRIAVSDHPVPAGPLAVRFLSYELGPLRAGTWSTVTVELENAGSGTWHPDGPSCIRLSHHTLDDFGNVLLWEGLRAPLPHPVGPGERCRLELTFGVPMPPGRYRLDLDLVDEGRLWFAELGNQPLELALEVGPRLDERSLEVRISDGAESALAETFAALDAQEEPTASSGAAIVFLRPGCRPAPDWSRRILDAHAAGFAAVGGSIEVTGRGRGRGEVARELAPWKPGFGAAPSWSHPLLCPSLLAGVAETVTWLEPVAGLPAVDPAVLADAWLCDGRIRVLVDARALRRGDRRRA